METSRLNHNLIRPHDLEGIMPQQNLCQPAGKMGRIGKENSGPIQAKPAAEQPEAWGKSLILKVPQVQGKLECL